MTVELAGLVTGLACLSAGHLVLSLLTRGARGTSDVRTPDVWLQRGRLEWLVTATLLGIVLLPTLVYLATLAFGPLPVWAGNGLLGVALLGGLVSLRQLPARRASSAAPWSGFESSLLVAAVLLVLVALVASSASPVHLFDPVFHFAYKGKLLFHEGLFAGGFTDVDGAVGRVMTHPSYPPLVPSLEVLASYPLGEFQAHVGRGLFFLFALAPAVWIAAALEDRGRRAQLVGALLWLSLPMIYYYRLPHNAGGSALLGLLLGPDGAGSLFGGSSWRTTDGASLDGGGDLPTAAFLCGAVLYMARVRRAAGDGLVAGVLLAGAVLAKNEGLALAAVLVCALVLAAGAGRWLAKDERLPGDRRALVAFGLALLITLPWFWFRARIPAVDESYPSLMKPASILSAMTDERYRAGGTELAPVTVAREYLRTFFGVWHWNLLWPLFLVAFGGALLAPRRALRRGAFLPLFLTAGALAAFFLILVVTPWHLGRLFTTGIPDRLFLQVAPLAAWGIAAWVFAPVEADGCSEVPR